ncbi:MAG: hypothetical protein PHU85_09265 [Phycisphaerae bacterium]|nr:hypothetical protein [Phycisphaerae bacterium]
MLLSRETRDAAMECARGIADWLCMVQSPFTDDLPPAGQFPWIIHPDGRQFPANNWNYAFAIMGLLHASKVFGQPRYERAALAMGDFLKGLQIFDPFHKEDYGAIREVTPYTRWCYTRDALSVAWSFIELHRHTKDPEYLERARLWGEWFLRKGRDEEGWPLWGHVFGPFFEAAKTQMRNDIQGSFQGGSLNCLYHMNKVTGDRKWIGDSFTTIADFLIAHVQQDSGFYASIERATHKPPPADPQNNLHRANDDLGTLGLLAACKVTGNKAYLASAEKFLRAVFAGQLEDGRFEESVACIPVVLNVLHEGEGMLQAGIAPQEARVRALNALFAAQSDGRFNPLMRGAILENGATHKEQVIGRQSFVCARSSCYALIVLLKLATGHREYLTV